MLSIQLEGIKNLKKLNCLVRKTKPLRTSLQSFPNQSLTPQKLITAAAPLSQPLSLGGPEGELAKISLVDGGSTEGGGGGGGGGGGWGGAGPGCCPHTLTDMKCV